MRSNYEGIPQLHGLLGDVGKDCIRTAERDVLQVDTVKSDAPPNDGNPNNDTVDSRALIGTDPYVNAGFDGNMGWIGLIDTGVRTSHVMLTGSPVVDLERDCYRGGEFCDDASQPGYSTTDTYSHGTRSAGIIAGRVNLGANWRGITTAVRRIDSWKVSDDLGGTDIDSVQRAYSQAVHMAEWGVAAVIQVNQPPYGSISAGANDLYDLGVAVFGANGNSTSGSSRAPANAHKALGVGGYITDDETNHGGVTGTPDGRHKPDLRMPTDVETATAESASGVPCDTCKEEYGGTSCATAHSVGVASLLRHYFVDAGFNSEPGNIYAGMIAFGSDSPNGTNGSGRTELAGPSCSRFQVGEVNLSNGQTSHIPISVGSGESDIQAAIWWPTEPGAHRDIDLRLYRPGFAPGNFSLGVSTVFERVDWSGPLQTGTWSVRIHAYSVPFGTTQKIYYVIHNKTC